MSSRTRSKRRTVARVPATYRPRLSLAASTEPLQQAETYTTLRPSRRPAADDVATFWAEGAPAATYYRCEIPGRALPANVAYADAATAEEWQAPGAPAIWQNPYSRAAQEFAEATTAPLLVDVDDNMLVPPAFVIDVMPPFWTERHLKETMPGHRSIVDRADAVIATTDTLADAYSRIHDNVVVVPHAVDPSDWENVRKPDDGIFRVGFAGSMAHYDDLPLIEPALRWASAQPGVEVVMIGIDPYWDFPYTHVSGVGLTRYRHELARFDVGLCPLVRNSWSVCRSDSKALEYTLAGATVVASHAEPFLDWWPYAAIVDSPAGFLEIVAWSIEHRDELPALVHKARAYVLGARTLTARVEDWRTALATASK